MISIKVPATSANIGPGFDCLGLALNIYNIFEISEDTDRLVIEADNPNIDIKKNEENLVYISIARLYKEAGKAVPPLRIMERVGIPVGRGLGSSAACIIAGLAAANRLLGDIFNKDKIIELAAELEGHPDNVSPALLGGLVISITTDKGIKYIHYNVGRNLKLMALIPDFTLSTHDARKILPPVINFKDAVFNVGRSSLLTAALITGNLKDIRYAVEDRLHQPYRLKLIPDSEVLFKTAYELGCDAFFISGSGSTLMSVVSDEGIIPEMQKLCSSLETKWRILPVEIDNTGAQITEY